MPDFQRFLAAFVARAVNASLGRWEAFWAPGSFSAVRLVSPEDVVEKTAYVLGNPVLAGLVRTARLWPGAWSDPDRIGAGAVDVDRPSHFFARDGAMPEKARLELTVPPGFGSAAEFRARVIAALTELEEDARRRFRKGFLGVEAVLAQKPMGRPRSIEPRRGLNPRVAARDRWKRVEALTRLKEFVAAYREALAARRAKKIGVIFPAGTYLLRVAHGVPCVGFG